MSAINQAVRLARAVRRAYARKWAFLGLAFLAFLITLLALARLDLLPDASRAQADTTSTQPVVSMTVASTSEPVASVPVAAELPVKITIPSINLSAMIANPSSTDIDVLDTALLRGAVRYPTSAKLGEAGNVILFGHSSYLPIVHNQAYKTFNGIQNLAEGDRITVSSGDIAYVYGVVSVVKENVASEAGIALTTTGHTLTLATCNSFGVKGDRFVVTAELVESYPLAP
jgi:LPXTG-site transpeptidase (sortase) family protein